MMPRKWVCLEAVLGGGLVPFVGKVDFPFHKALEGGKGFVQLECLMRESVAGWRPYPEPVEGVFGQGALRRERIVGFYPIRESAAHWEGVWRACGSS